MASNIPVIVQGNSFSLAIPLQIYYIDGDQMDLQDYTPDPTDDVTVQLKGSRRNYTYTPTIDGNVANIDLTGNELADNYAVMVSIVKDNGQRLRSFRTDQFFIVESSDDLTTDDIIQGLEENVIYLNSSIFVAGEDGRGIENIVKTSTSGLVDTYTITYTDNTTSTFNVTNGKDGINGQDGKDGADGQDGVGIASIAKTGTQGLVDTYTITMTNGTTYTYQVTNGKDGENGRDGTDGQDGTDGVGIVSITKTSTSGLVDTYTILLTNGTTTTFTVTNGSDATQVQSDWSQNDSTAVDFIKNKPTIPTVPTNVSAFNNDAGYLNNNFCPIIEDTRSSKVATITGVAPFATLASGQIILLHLAYGTTNSTKLKLTLSGGTDTDAINVMYSNLQAYTVLSQIGGLNTTAGMYLHLIYNGTNWIAIGFGDGNTQYAVITQSDLNTGTATASKTITAKIFHDNAYIVEESYSSGSLKANKFYDFGTVSSALTIPNPLTTNLVSNALNFYALRFIAGADNLSITFPTGVIVDDEPTINTGDYVEIMINKYGNNYYASIKVWQAP